MKALNELFEMLTVSVAITVFMLFALLVCSQLMGPWLAILAASVVTTPVLVAVLNTTH